MSKFRDLIAAEAENIRGLNAAVKAKSKRRDQSASAREEWKRAAHRFHQYESLLGDWLRHVETGNIAANPDLKDFVITYLEMDPRYFRSGYIKERLLHKLKSAKLNKAEAARVAEVLIDAVRQRGGREFRHYCRLAAILQQQEVIGEVRRLAESSDRGVAARARMMLHHLERAADQ